jgi:hypothetical protein
MDVAQRIFLLWAAHKARAAALEFSLLLTNQKAGAGLDIESHSQRLIKKKKREPHFQEFQANLNSAWINYRTKRK